MTIHSTLEHPARSVPADAAPAHMAQGVEQPPTRLAMLGLAAWIGLCALAASRHALLSWHYFATAGQTLLTAPGGGLHVYGEHPELQFGPLTMAVCALIGLSPEAVGAATACMLMLALGLGTAAALGSLRCGQHGARVSSRMAMVYAALTAPLWLVLAVHYGHLDDALALFFMAAAVALCTRDRWVVAAVLLAAAAGAKPWVVPMAMLLLAAPRPARLKASAVFVLGTAIPWIPFVLADSRTMQLSRFVISVADDSVLRQFGSLSVATPTWVRPAQFVLGAALAVWLVRRGRWMCVPFAVLSVRLLIDPQTYLYYSTGLALAAAIADLTRNDRRPILTGLVFGWSAVATVLATAGQLTGAGTARLVGLLAGIVAVMVDDGWSPTARRPAHHDVSPVADVPVRVARQTEIVAVADLADPTPPLPLATQPVEEPRPITTVRVESRPDPPKLGQLWSQTRRPLRPLPPRWSQTRRPVRPVVSSRLIRR